MRLSSAEASRRGGEKNLHLTCSFARSTFLPSFPLTRISQAQHHEACQTSSRPTSLRAVRTPPCESVPLSLWHGLPRSEQEADARAHGAVECTTSSSSSALRSLRRPSRPTTLRCIGCSTVRLLPPSPASPRGHKLIPPRTLAHRQRLVRRRPGSLRGQRRPRGVHRGCFLGRPGPRGARQGGGGGEQEGSIGWLRRSGEGVRGVNVRGTGCSIREVTRRQLAHKVREDEMNAH